MQLTKHEKPDLTNSDIVSLAIYIPIEIRAQAKDPLLVQALSVSQYWETETPNLHLSRSTLVKSRRLNILTFIAHARQRFNIYQLRNNRSQIKFALAVDC